MDTPSNPTLPQQSQSGPSFRMLATHQRGPMAFKQGENVLFERVTALETFTQQHTTFKLACRTAQFNHRTVWTHETTMHQMKDLKQAGRPVQIDITFWNAAVFRVRFRAGELPQTPPDFPPPAHQMLTGTPAADVEIQVAETDDRWLIRTTAMTLHIHKNPFNLVAYDSSGKVFWQQRRSDLFTSDIFDTAVSHHQGHDACFESIYLHPQEMIYGLGERFDHVVRNGKTVDFWNKDAIGTSNRRTYLNVPFLLSTAGYGLFLNSSYRTEWEIGTLEAFTLGFAVESDLMDYFVIYGPTPADILRRYALLTGFAPVPPVWSFGLWMSRNSYISWDVVENIAQHLRNYEIPTDVLHLDTAWFKTNWNCDLRFSEERFPNPVEHMRVLREKGFRVSLWQYNFVPPKPDNANYSEGRSKGYFAKDVNGEVYRHPEGAQGSWLDDAVIDFSNPQAVEWYTEQVKGLIEMGAATIKTDFGEGIPEDACYHSIDGYAFHNLYSLVYNAALFEAVREVSGEGIVWARSGTAGSQRYPVHWGGDSQCSFAGLAGTLRAALSMGLSGFPYFSHDIGGFIGRPDPELYIRWAQFGLFSSHSRCHGAGDSNPREPWIFGEEALSIFRRYANLRYQLLPYLLDQARKAAQTAKPIVRALVIDYPQDRNVWPIDDQYLFGDSLLIAPILRPLSETDQRHIYLPAGIWYDYWTKASLQSHGKWIIRKVDLETMPIYVKAGAVLPYGKKRQHTNNEVGSIVSVEAYAAEAGTITHDDSENCFTALWQDGDVRIEGLIDIPVTVYR